VTLTTHRLRGQSAEQQRHDRLAGETQEAITRARLFRPHQRPVAVDQADWAGLCSEAGNLLWVDLQAPSEDEFARVIKAFNIDARAAAIARSVKRRPIVRAFDDHYLVTLLSFQVDETQRSPRIRVVEIDLLIGKNFMVSLHKRPLPFAEELAERTEAIPQRSRLDSTSLLYVFLDTLVAAYGRQLDQVERRVERLQLELLREPGRRALDDAILMTRHVQTLRRLVSPHSEAVATLLTVDSPFLQPTAMETNFRDLLGQVRSLVDHLDHTRDLVTGGYTLYISNVSFRTNEQLKVLTVLSAILLPTTLITGLFGTNFKLAEYDAWEPFYVMLVGMGIIAWAMLLFFRWRRWL
jgi:magnesium transporter